MNNIDLTNSVVFSLTVEKDKTLNKTFKAEVYDNDLFIGYFDFSEYTGASLVVKKSPKSYPVLAFSTTDNSIVLGSFGEFTIAKGANQMFIGSGQYVYEMELYSASETRGFMRGKFLVYDEGYGEVEQDINTSEPIRINVKAQYVVTPIPTGGTSIYDGASPSTVTVGGLNAGAVLTGKTANQILESILVPTLNPTLVAPSITSFSQNLATTQEVGVSVTPTFTTNFSRGTITPAYGTSGFRSGTPTKYKFSGNGNSRQINTTATSNTSAATGATTLVAGANTWGVYVAYGAGEQPKNSAGANFSTPLASGSTSVSQTTITGIYPYFWGKVASGGAASGANRPTATSALVSGGNKVVASSTGTISITFAATSDDYLWFAIPATSTSKTVWYVSALNNGLIGGSVSPGGNLFPAESIVSVTTVLWAGVSYKVYISNYQSATSGAMEMRNS